ncbi:MAG TPA: hypothetical protein VF014_09025, partial [Casimicrobiaceae bacterium]|nr:hypothetical protein [Casimicrobiaceae bacterium]
FTCVRLPETHLTGSLPPFPATLTTPAIVPEQLAVVWTLILQSESEGPTLISCAAKLLKGDLLFPNLPLAPSWRTAPEDLGGGQVCPAAVSEDD